MAAGVRFGRNPCASRHPTSCRRPAGRQPPALLAWQSTMNNPLHHQTPCPYQWHRASRRRPLPSRMPSRPPLVRHDIAFFLLKQAHPGTPHVEGYPKGHAVGPGTIGMWTLTVRCQRPPHCANKRPGPRRHRLYRHALAGPVCVAELWQRARRRPRRPQHDATHGRHQRPHRCRSACSKKKDTHD